jgi:Rrf2 family protein
LRALYSLARQYGKGPTLIATLSREEEIPHKFLELILLDLRNRGVVASKKGKNGGYYLAQPPEQVTIGALIRMLEGPLAPLPCASETAFRRCDECVDENVCGTRIVMKRVRDAMAEILDRTTLADVCHEVDALKQKQLPTEAELMYYI